MEAPTSIKFWAPVTADGFDATAEPTLETQNGLDVLGQAIAAGGQAIGFMDGRPNQLVTVDTDGERGTWRADVFLAKYFNIDAFIIDQENMNEAYPHAKRTAFNMRSHTADVYASGTDVTREKVMSGLLGRERPLLELDGDDDRATPIVAVAFKSVVIDLFHNDNSGQKIIAEGAGSNAFYIRGNGSYSIFVGGGHQQDVTVEAITGRRYQLAFVQNDNNDGYEIFIDGVSQGDINSNGLLATLREVGAATESIDGKVYGWAIWTRKLVASELVDLLNGGDILEADMWSDGADLITNGSFAADTDWTKSDGTVTISAGAAHFAASTNGQSIFQVPGFVQGVIYTIQVTVSNLSEGALFIRYPFSTAGDPITADGTYLYTAEADQGIDRMQVNSSGASTTADIDDLSALIAGANASYPPDGLSKDQGKWLDASTNDNHAVVVGAKFVNAPEGTTALGFYLEEFTAVANTLFWFMHADMDDGSTNALADFFAGLITQLTGFVFTDVIAGGFTGTHGFGVKTLQSDVGQIFAEKVSGESNSWNLIFSKLTATQWVSLKEFMARIEPSDSFSLYPFYFTSNYDEADPVVHRVRMVGKLRWGYFGQATKRWSPSMLITTDL